MDCGRGLLGQPRFCAKNFDKSRAVSGFWLKISPFAEVNRA
jgi:hypothetical protein